MKNSSLCILILLCALVVSTTGGALGKETVVYESTWTKASDAIGGEWATEGRVVIAPKGTRVFLGAITARGARFRLENLPAHKVVKLQFDLIIRGSWDGASGGGGPDTVKIELEDGRLVLHSSFRVFENTNEKQSFPWPVEAGAMAKSGYGSSELRTLGYLWATPTDEKWKADGVFPIETYFPHSARTFGFAITTQAVDDKYQEQWAGLDNVKVTVLENELAISDKDWAALEKDLNGEDGMKAFAAANRMAGAPARVRRMLAGPDDAVDPVHLDKLIKDLVNEDFKVRKAAQQELEQLPKSALTQLRAAQLAHDDPEAIVLLKKAILRIRAAEAVERKDPWLLRLEHLVNVRARRR